MRETKKSRQSIEMSWKKLSDCSKKAQKIVRVKNWRKREEKT